MRSKILFAELAFFLLLFVPISSGLGVEGVIFEAEAAPGQHVDHEITVSLRDNEAPMDLQVDIQDWGQTLEGSNQELEEGDVASYSAKGFLKASPSSFHLEPGESRKVLVEGDIPEDVGPGGRYALISVHSLPLVGADEGSEGNVGVAVAINALVRLTISGTEISRIGEITDIRAEDPSEECQNISLIFKNTGNYHFSDILPVSLLPLKTIKGHGR